MLQQRFAVKRFRQEVSPEIRRIERWKKSGSVKTVDFGGRQNVLCLQSNKRAARLRYEIFFVPDVEKTFSIEVFSPIGNTVWGCGSVTGESDGWDPSNGMWKRLEVKVKQGTEVVIEASGQGREITPGDKCYVDLSSIQVR